MERKTLIAILVSLGFIIFYQYVLGVLYPDYRKTPSQVTTQDTPDTYTSETETKPAFPVEQAAPPQTAEIAATPATADARRRMITQYYEAEFSERYGSAVTLALTAYTDYEKKTNLQFLGATDPVYGVAGFRLWVDRIEQSPDLMQTRFNPSSVETAVSENDFHFIRILRFNRSLYGNEIELEFQNRGAATREIQVELSAGSGVIARSAIDHQYIEANWIMPDSVKHVKSPGDGKSKIAEAPARAASIKSRHFSSILEPLDGAEWTPVVRGLASREFASALLSPKVTLAPGESWKQRVFLYVGPNSVEILEPYGLSSIVNFGKLDTICKFFLGGLQLAHKITRNYGVAIILLTLGMNVLLLPLTKASFMSMRRMQLVQPEMTKMREKYKKDPQRMNKEMMELYRKHKVNPMGGCLPMLVQMPVFISLYVTLSKSTELLGSNFLWVNDLASPDLVPLPFALPLVGQTLHVLPLIMVGAMVVQQRLSMASMQSADPQAQQMQKMMLYMMPIFFGFIFYPMPSGLVIYWLTNTMVMSSYQMFLKRTVKVIK